MGNFCERISANPKCIDIGLCCYKCTKQCDNRCLELAMSNIDSIIDCPYNIAENKLKDIKTAISIKESGETSIDKNPDWNINIQ